MTMQTDHETRELEAQVGRLRNEVDMKEEATLSLVAAWLVTRGQQGLAKRIHPHHGDEVRRSHRNTDKGNQFNWDLDKKETAS